jgi:hypothetical protein
MSGFTEADVQLVAEALLRDYPRPDRALAERFDTEARAVLAALADAGRLTPADAPEPLAEKRSMLVLGSCGHWWRETQPAGLRLRPEAPRVCSLCRPGGPGVVGTSPQGLGMVNVEYRPWVAADGTP